MKAIIIIFICIYGIYCSQPESKELHENTDLFSSFYDVLVFNDILDVLNENERQFNPYGYLSQNEVSSDENVESLLQEYNNHLENKLVKMFEPTKIDGKVPRYQYPVVMPRLEETFNLPNIMYNPLTMPVQMSYSALDLVPPILNEETCKCKPKDVYCQCKKCSNCSPQMQDNREKGDETLESLRQISNIDDTVKESNKDKINTDNKINFKIEVEFKFPNIQNAIPKIKDTKNVQKIKDKSSNELALETMHASFPFINFAIPLRNKKTRKNLQLHSTKKKNIKKIKNNKRKKKLRRKFITFHNIDFESTTPNVTSQNNNSNIYFSSANSTISTTNEPFEVLTTDAHLNITHPDNNYNSLLANVTDEIPLEDKRNENDTEIFNYKVSKDEKPDLLTRKKRSVSDEVYKTEKTDNAKNSIGKSNNSLIDKHIIADTELLYWPGGEKTQKPNYENNITMLVVDKDKKKTKIAMNKTSLKYNHTEAIERALFGEVNWTDVDSLIPIFTSFFGKYLNGVLTLCSDNLCHSLKCSEKICIHRTCLPISRHSSKAHCTGSNATDSVVSMEALMDLPTNVASEIIDILQEKLFGKLYGKATICISNKCITFVSVKKMFHKTKCSSKELDLMGQCPLVKNMKNR